MPNDFLSRIVERKKQEVEAAKATKLLKRLDSRNQRPFLETLRKPGPYGVNIIAEIKRASPSKGPIRADLDAAAYAAKYEEGGAAAISVLTDRDHFQGSFEDLRIAREASSLPVLRKDFIIDTYQLHESYIRGADAVLLIAKILSKHWLSVYVDVSRSAGVESLVEVHSRKELDWALEAKAGLIGINNRNLETFETDIRTAEKLAKVANLLRNPPVLVAESGIHSRDDILRLKDAGIHNFLIGESLVRAADPVAALRQLMGADNG